MTAASEDEAPASRRRARKPRAQTPADAVEVVEVRGRAARARSRKPRAQAPAEAVEVVEVAAERAAGAQAGAAATQSPRRS